MPPYKKETLPVIFRPPKIGLWMFRIIYVLCLAAALFELIYVIHSRHLSDLISVFVQILPCFLAWVILARRYSIEKD
jgi:ABC-type multidrug transport system permease subunit